MMLGTKEVSEKDWRTPRIVLRKPALHCVLSSRTQGPWQGSWPEYPLPEDPELLGSGGGNPESPWGPGRVLRSESLAYRVCSLSLLFWSQTTSLSPFHLPVPAEKQPFFWAETPDQWVALTRF